MTTTTTRPAHNRPERLAREATAALSRAAFRTVLGTPCPAHGLPAGVPCWTVPDDVRERPALCDARVRRAGYRGAVSDRSTRRVGPGGERR